MTPPITCILDRTHDIICNNSSTSSVLKGAVFLQDKLPTQLYISILTNSEGKNDSDKILLSEERKHSLCGAFFDVIEETF